MPQYRKDPLSDRWVIIAEGRDDRPNEFEQTPRRRIAHRCPFCAGHEDATPPAVALYTAADAPVEGPGLEHESGPRGDRSDARRDADWLVRVVPNKYPAVSPDAPTRSHASDLYQWRGAVGIHEVIVESPRHVSSVTELSETEAYLLLIAYRDRLLHLQKDERFQYALVFKNLGPEGGASLAHAHSQIVATPGIPREVLQELRGAKRWWSEHRGCYFCGMVEFERQAASRVVAQCDEFIALCPFASRMPFEIWILPRRHQSHFETQRAAELKQAANFLRDVLERLEWTHPHVAYNYYVHTGPFDTSPLAHYHWHIEIFPRLTTTAGFEWGTGYFINPVPPEEAAAVLRSATQRQHAETATLRNRKTS